jgi:uncharacterized membrane protein
MRRTPWTWAWSLVGTGIGVYLTVLHYTALPVGCPATPTINCEAVLTSPGSMVGPLPLAAWGCLWALVPLLVRRAWTVWVALGLAGLVWAVGHEVALGQICLWCTAFQVAVLGEMAAARPLPRRPGADWQGMRHMRVGRNRAFSNDSARPGTHSAPPPHP